MSNDYGLPTTRDERPERVLKSVDRPPAKTEQHKSGRRFSITQLEEPDWIYFAIATYATAFTIAALLRGSPAHGWMVANLKPTPLLATSILVAAVERVLGHFVRSKYLRCIVRPISLSLAALAAIAILYYGQV